MSDVRDINEGIYNAIKLLSGLFLFEGALYELNIEISRMIFIGILVCGILLLIFGWIAHEGNARTILSITWIINSCICLWLNSVGLFGYILTIGIILFSLLKINEGLGFLLIHRNLSK